MSRRVLWPTRGEALASMASAALFAVAFPPFPFVVPVFVCLVPFAVAVARRADASESARSALRIGFWFGLLGYACNLYWIAIALSIYTNLAFLGYVATILVIGPIIAVTAAALFAARRATRLPLAILLPVVWVTSELLFNYLSDLAFPWLPLGLAMSHVPLMAQAADVSGVRGLSFWIAATNGLIADAYLLRHERRAVLARATVIVVLAGAVAAYGAWRLRSTTLVRVASVAIVQPNIPQQEKWQEENRQRIVGILASLTEERLARRDADLVLWPEAALPGFLIEHPEWRDTVRALTRQSGTPILFGVLDVTFHPSGVYEYFNAALLADVTGNVRSQPAYHKQYLVPIVERVPFVNPRWFAHLKYFGGYARGHDPTPFTLPFGRVGVLICYESIFPQLSRYYRRRGATILVNITNDAWFGRSIAPYQHEAHLSLRAIENRVGIVRAANTGISGYVDPLGRLHGATALFTREARTYEAQTTNLRPLYVRAGDWVGALSALATLSALAYAIRLRRRP